MSWPDERLSASPEELSSMELLLGGVSKGSSVMLKELQTVARAPVVITLLLKSFIVEAHASSTDILKHQISIEEKGQCL
jgi:hypothetical protein